MKKTVNVAIGGCSFIIDEDACNTISNYLDRFRAAINEDGSKNDVMDELESRIADLLKAKLGAMGLFDPSHKKPIPKFPDVIGIVTSEAGAAVHDMLRILNKRYQLTKVRLFPVRVQGVEAPGEIAAAIRYANYHNLADVLIVGRGCIKCPESGKGNGTEIRCRCCFIHNEMLLRK